MGDEAKAKTLYAEIHQEFQAALQERSGGWDRQLSLGSADASVRVRVRVRVNDEAISQG